MTIASSDRLAVVASRRSCHRGRVFVTLRLLRPSAVEIAVTGLETVPPEEVVLQAEPPVVRFTDVTSQSGLTFVHTNGAYGDKLLPETMGSGVVVLDWDLGW